MLIDTDKFSISKIKTELRKRLHLPNCSYISFMFYFSNFNAILNAYYVYSTIYVNSKFDCNNLTYNENRPIVYM